MIEFNHIDMVNHKHFTISYNCDSLDRAFRRLKKEYPDFASKSLHIVNTNVPYEENDMWIMLQFEELGKDIYEYK